MRIICTTSNHYHHALKVFCYLFNKFWIPDSHVTVLGYNQPEFKLPDNFSFISMGEQKGPSFWCTDLKQYINLILDKNFILMMEDGFLNRPINLDLYKKLCSCINSNIGRIDLTQDMSTREYSHYKYIQGMEIVKSNQEINYRISTQISIWSKSFMLDYLIDGRSPWEFEIKGSEEARKDNRLILGTTKKDGFCVSNLEGVRKQNINHLNLNGLDDQTLRELKDNNLI